MPFLTNMITGVSAGQVTETADRLFMTAAERTTVGSFSNVMTFPGVQAAVDAGTNATAAIQAAIDACAPSGIPLFFPAGTYRVKNLLLRANTNIFGSGRLTIFKQLDGIASWDAVIAETGSGIHNVRLRSFMVDGNKAAAVGTVQMHGIKFDGANDNLLIEDVHAKDCFSDGFWITASGSGANIPTNVTLRRCSAENCGRMDFALINVNGATVEDCYGNGMFDIEANSNAETCKNINVSNLRFNAITFGTLAASSTGTSDSPVTGTNLIAVESIAIWGVRKGTFSNLVCPGKITLSVVDGVTLNSVHCGALRTSSLEDSYFSRNVVISGLRVHGNSTLTYGVRLDNTYSHHISDAIIRTGDAAGSRGIDLDGDAPFAGGRNVFKDVTIEKWTDIGIYINAATSENMETVLENVTVLAGEPGSTNALQHSVLGSYPYGTLKLRDCEFNGPISLGDHYRVSIRDCMIIGDHNLNCTSSPVMRLVIDGLKFRRATAGTPALTLTGCADVQELVLKDIAQEPAGSVSVSLSTSVFGANVKAWIDGLVAESTSWATNLADANVKEGSMYRLRGNATNWGYTHNGTAWVAKAH